MRISEQQQFPTEQERQRGNKRATASVELVIVRGRWRIHLLLQTKIRAHEVSVSPSLFLISHQ